MLDTILRIIALTRKELLAVLKDRRARMSLLIPPIVQGLIFGYAASYDLNHVPYAVLDQDRSAASRELLAGLDEAERLRGVDTERLEHLGGEDLAHAALQRETTVGRA